MELIKRVAGNNCLIFLAMFFLFPESFLFLEECEPGKYGEEPVTCSLDCPLQCKDDLCNRQNGSCIDGCKDYYLGDTCHIWTKCINVSGDPRGKPGIMNDEAGASVNIFVNLTMPRSGNISLIQYHAEASNPVYVSFWRRTDLLEGVYTFLLVGKIYINTVSDFGEIDVRQEQVNVREGDVLGVHYPTNNTRGKAIRYHRSDKGPHLGISNDELYGVVNPNIQDGNWIVNEYDYSGSIKEYLKAPAVRVFFECTLACEPGLWGNGPEVCEQCSAQCRDDQPCHQYSGTCPTGCVQGWTSLQCNTVLKENEKQENPQEGIGAGAIAGIVVAIVVILVVLGIILFILYRKKKRRSKRRKVYIPEAVIRTTDEDSMQFEVTHKSVPIKSAGKLSTLPLDSQAESAYSNETTKPIPIKDMGSYIARNMSEEEPFRKEFESIPSAKTESWNFAEQKELKQKNRFKNILPYDHNRVVLSLIKEDPLTSYINASFIPDYNKEKAFIASSGPTTATLDDFWRMVWENEITCIVMVTNFVENMTVKCERYWPESLQESVAYGEIAVSLESEDHWIDFDIRTMKITKDDKSSRVTHYMYTGWPDHGVPQHAASLLKIRRDVVQLKPKTDAPILIHCSAGIGRTGTFIAVDHLLDQGRQTGVVDVYNCVNKLRSYRVNMVQTRDQYIFIYDAVCEALLFGDTCILCENIEEWYTNALHTTAAGSTLKQIFKFLEERKSVFSSDEYDQARSPENVSKNRNPKVLPADKHCIYVENNTNGQILYINAVFVDGYKQRKRFIATQLPLKSTVSDFWELVADYNCVSVVCLEDTTDGCMWYPGPEGPMQCNGIIISCVDTKMKEGIIHHSLQLTQKSQEQSPETEYANIGETHIVKTRNIKLFLLPKSKTSNTPLDPTLTLTLIKQVNNWQHLNNISVPIAVLCSDGASKCGLYIASSNIISMMDVENNADFFQTVKACRTTRPEFITSVEQFGFLHEIAVARTKSQQYEDV